MALVPSSYPLDLTGANVRNKITNDTYTLTNAEDMVFIPSAGPFFTRTLVIRSGSVTLKPNVDYKCLHLLRDATIESGLDVSAVVMITKENLTTVTLNYQAIGGKYADTVPVIRQLLDNANSFDKGINWNTQVYAKPDLFPPAPHFVSGDEFSDWGDVVMGIRGIERAILLKDVAAWESMYQYLENLINNKISLIDLTSYATKTYVNAEVVKLALKSDVYTKTESDARYYTKSQIEARIGDIDGNETYYTEKEINAKFIETVVADAKYPTKAQLNAIDTKKADIANVYTRAQSDEKYAEKVKVYSREWVDSNLALKGLSYTKSESDLRYSLKGDAYTRLEADNRFALRSQIQQAPDLSDYITASYVEGVYLKMAIADSTYIRKTTADSLYAKITDLKAIDVVDAKFNNYYTKVDSDNKFATKLYLDGTFLSKTLIAQQYPSKTEVSTTYSTKVELNVAKTDLNKTIGLKADTTWVTANFPTKTNLTDGFYSKVESDNKYFNKTHITSNYVDNSKLASALSPLATKVEVNKVNTDLTNKFAGYYTKVESDALYFNKTHINATFTPLTKLTEVDTTLKALINTKVNTTTLAAAYYTKKDSDAKFALISSLTANYFDKVYLENYFIRTTELTAALVPYYKTADFNTNWNWLKTDLARYAVKTDVYTKVETDGKYIPKTTNRIEIRGTGSNVENYGLDIIGSDTSSITGGSLRFFVGGAKNATISTRNDATAKTSELKVTLQDLNTGSYVSGVAFNLNGIWHKNYGWLHDRFLAKGDAYSKAEVDKNFQRLEPNHVVAKGANADFLSTREDPTSTVSGSFYWRRGGQILGGIHNSFDSTAQNWRMNFLTPDTPTGNADISFFITSSRIWHKTYGYLDAYFRKASDSYTKSEVYNKSETFNKTEVNASFYTKSQIDSTYVSNSSLNTTVTSLNNSINQRATTAWVIGNYFNKTEADGRYYQQSWINANVYTQAKTNEIFYTKALASADLAKKLDVSVYNSFVTSNNAAIAKKLDIETAKTTYIPASTLPTLLTVDAAKNTYATQANLSNNYYNKNDINNNYLTGAGVKSITDELGRRISVLESKLEFYKIGDIYITTINYTNGSAVSNALGYGTWIRYAQGRTLVGFSPTGAVDDIPGLRHDSVINHKTAIMGKRYGAYTHRLVDAELPQHNHAPNNVFNKYVARAQDVLEKEQYNFYGDNWIRDRLTANATDDNHAPNELMIAGYTDKAWAESATVNVGQNWEHNNIQPSITVGMWLRIDPNSAPPQLSPVDTYGNEPF